MKVRTLIAGAAVMLLCGGIGVAIAADAPPAAAAPKGAPSSASKSKHHHMHHHRGGKSHGQKEFTEQQLQEMQTQPPSK